MLTSPGLEPGQLVFSITMAQNVCIYVFSLFKYALIEIGSNLNNQILK